MPPCSSLGVGQIARLAENARPRVRVSDSSSEHCPPRLAVRSCASITYTFQDKTEKKGGRCLIEMRGLVYLAVDRRHLGEIHSGSRMMLSSYVLGKAPP